MKLPSIQHWLFIEFVFWVITVILTSLITIIFLCSFSNPIGIDSWFHLKYSHIIHENQEIIFKWLPYTIYDEFYPDHHYGFHILLSLFSWCDDLIINAKIYTWIQLSFIVIIMVSSVRELSHYKYSFSFIPMIIIFFSISSIFNIRILMIRAQGISVALINLYIVYLLKKNHLGIFMVSLLLCMYFKLQYMYLPVISLIHIICERKFNKPSLLSFIYTIIGGLIGLLFHPNIFESIKHIYFYLGIKTLLPVKIIVGGEWYPYSIENFFLETYVLLILIYPIIFFSSSNKYIKENQRFLFILFLLLFILALMSKRHIELLIPPLFTVSMVLVSDWIENHKSRKIFMITLTIISIYFFYMNLNKTQRYIELFDFARVCKNTQNASQWLLEHSDENDIILNLDWGIFPILFSQNMKNRYTWGLDPKYLYYHDKEKFMHIYFFRDSELTSKSLMEMFKANYMIVSSGGLMRDKMAIQKIEQDQSVKKVYDDYYYNIYTIKGSGS